MTRAALARQINCSPSTIKKIERDERRPSLQVAELLADRLAVPLHVRDRFLRMARGEFVATPLSAADLVALPPSQWPGKAHDDDEPTVVARDKELAQLDARLASAVAGNGGMLFITGEAGDGKTTLAHTFARRSQDQYPELIAVAGNCNAFTGAGDPYLPFREILALLTGDIQGRANLIARQRSAAERLWRLVPCTVEALLDAGPDLVGPFLPETALLARVECALPGPEKPLLERLRALTGRREERSTSVQLQQSDLLAQYTRVLRHLARQHPLLLVIDDMQWIDLGSINLLFHLSRCLAGERILLVGVYRAAEVALGRGGKRHPLEPLVNELQRAFGDIQIRLNQTDGRAFVDALVDIEPNRLDSAFRDALYRQTAGHPLFTVEMLHGLQNRGDLTRNDCGEWVASPALDWHIMPARVEGIVKERIGRLPPVAQGLAETASVVGESFGAETLAHIQALDEGQVIGLLEHELGQGQRLVSAQGIQRLGTRQLSQYRFRHIVFQQYLYTQLSPIQRAYLHRAVARELEQFYGPEATLIAPQLAHHHLRAGDTERAVHYLTIAGDAAAAVYAGDEAVAHYRRALDLLQGAGDAPTDFDRQIELYTRLGRVLELSARHDAAIAVYKELEDAAAARGAQAAVLTALLGQAAIRTTVNFARDPDLGQQLLERAHGIALDLGDQAAEARILWNLLILSAYTGGDPEQRLVYGEEAVALARRLGLQEQLAFALHDAFYAYAGIGQWERARAAVHEACDLWQSLNNLPMLSEAHTRLHWAYLVTGDYNRASVHAQEAAHLADISHNRDAQAISHFMLGMIHWERGELEQARVVMEEDIAVAESVRSLTSLIGTRADLGLLYGEMGDMAHGMELATLARATAEESLSILQSWPRAIQVILALRGGDLDAAQAYAATLEDYRTVQRRFGYMPFMWIRVGLAHGEFALQQGAYAQAVTLMDALYADLAASDIWYLRADVLHLKGRALLGLHQGEEARGVLQDARYAAETLDSRRALMPILDSLSEPA